MPEMKSGVPNDELVNTVESDDGTTWVEIASVGTEDEARLLEGFLEAEGIDAQVENVTFSMEPVTFGKMGEIRVYVKSHDETRAMGLLRSREEEYEKLDDDSETLVTDEGPANIDEMSSSENDDDV
jgi:hypothetical protein